MAKAILEFEDTADNGLSIRLTQTPVEQPPTKAQSIAADMLKLMHRIAKGEVSYEWISAPGGTQGERE